MGVCIYLCLTHAYVCLLATLGVDESIKFAFSTQQCLFLFLFCKVHNFIFSLHACMWSHFNFINVILIGLVVYHVTLFLSVDFLSVEKVSHDAD